MAMRSRCRRGSTGWVMMSNNQKKYSFQIAESRNNKAGRFLTYMDHFKALAKREGGKEKK